ncbi:hypothetical protein CRUP_015771 [Coryphaenoides rupestris]|nr:hypothetical protein CRUP_015771 [Coryphaenoides rupestris]
MLWNCVNIRKGLWDSMTWSGDTCGDGRAHRGQLPALVTNTTGTLYLPLRSTRFLKHCLAAGLLANAGLMWTLLSSKKPLSPSEVLALNLAVMDMVICLCLPMDIYRHLCPLSAELTSVNDALGMLKVLGCPLLLTFMCFERYLAVARPLAYIKLGRWEYRGAMCACAWTVTLALAICAYFLGVYSIILYLALTMLVLFLLMLLCLSGPGEGSANNVPLKRRALKNILAVAVPAVMVYGPLVGMLPLVAVIKSQYNDSLLANAGLMWTLLSSKKPLSPSEVLALNLAVMDMVICLCLPMDIYRHLCPLSAELTSVNDALGMLKVLGCPLLLTFMCFERYLAVARPLAYIKLGRWEYRGAMCACAWTVTLALAICAYFLGVYSIILYLALTMLVLFLLMLLCLSGPGEGSANNVPLKRRALKNILAVAVPAVMVYGPLVGMLPLVAVIKDRVTELHVSVWFSTSSLIATGLLANAGLMWTLLSSKKPLSPSEVLALNLAVMDMVICLCLPMDIYRHLCPPLR